MLQQLQLKKIYFTSVPHETHIRTIFNNHTKKQEDRKHNEEIKTITNTSSRILQLKRIQIYLFIPRRSIKSIQNRQISI